MPMVLVVDDDAEILGAVGEVLETAGYSVQLATSGPGALALTRNGARPDVILLDVRMPEMDGWHFLSARLRQPELVHVPIVLMSASDEARTVRGLGAVGFVRKPFHLETLLRAIRTTLEDPSHARTDLAPLPTY